MFSSHGAKFSLFLIFIFYYVTATGANQVGNKSITISMNKTVTFGNREIYGQLIKLHNYSTVKINFNKLPGDTNFTFLVLQAHSFKNKINLYQNTKAKGNVVCGTNVGMVSIIKDALHAKAKITDVYYIENINDAFIHVYISVHVYYQTDPYPGGCNNDLQVGISPFLKVNTKKDYITVDAAVASFDSKCAISYDNLSKFYMLYLPEMSFEEEQYFNGLRKMMTLDYIDQFGTLIPQTSFEMRRTLSAYPGTGVIVVALTMVVVGNTTGYSVYVPNHSYGCLNLDEDGCNKSHDVVIQALCMTLQLVGLFLAFYGHQNFKTEMFLSGFLCGFVSSYLILEVKADMCTAKLGQIPNSVASGLFWGIIWFLLWRRFGSPTFSMILPSLNVGFLLASVFYYGVPPLGLNLVDDTNFWSVFIIIMVLTAVALVAMSCSCHRSANILCCSVTGSSITVFGLDCCVQSNLQYIIINFIRRAVVPKFRYAIIAPLIQSKERTMILTWITLTISGFVYQRLKNRGRSHFPTIQTYQKSTIQIYGSTKGTPKKLQESDHNTSKTLKFYLISRNRISRNKRTPLVPGA